MRKFDAFRYLRRSDGVAKPPAGDGVGLGQRGAGDGPLPHAGEGGEIDVPVGRIDDVLIYFVCNDIGVILHSERRDQFQFFMGEHFPAGIGGIAQDQRLGALAKGVLQHLRVKAEFRRRQGHINGFRTGEDGVCAVVFVERREDDYLVPGIDHRHHGGHHGLGAAAGDGDLAVGVNGPAHIAGLLCRQGLPEVLRAPGNRVLMYIFPRDLRQPVQNGLGRLEVRKPLGEVDGTVPVGDPGHAPDHRVGEMRRAGG